MKEEEKNIKENKKKCQHKNKTKKGITNPPPPPYPLPSNSFKEDTEGAGGEVEETHGVPFRSFRPQLPRHPSSFRCARNAHYRLWAQHPSILLPLIPSPLLFLLCRKRFIEWCRLAFSRTRAPPPPIHPHPLIHSNLRLMSTFTPHPAFTPFFPLPPLKEDRTKVGAAHAAIYVTLALC